MNLSFKQEHFNTIFPFYILIDADLSIRSVGNSLLKLYPIKEKSNFSSIFSFKRPALIVEQFEDLHLFQQQPLSLNVGNSGIVLRGQLVYFSDENCFLFIGSPWFNSMDEVRDNHLTISDFAIHDSMIDLLHVIKTQEIAADDTKEILQRLNIQTTTLKKEQLRLQRLSLVARTNRNGVIFLNNVGEITWHNERFEEMTGYASAEILGNTLAALCTPSNEAEYLRNIFQNFNENINTEIIFHTKYLNKYWINIKIQKIASSTDTTTQFFAIIEDINDKKIANEQLRASENRLASLIANFQSAILLEDESRKIVIANKPLCEIFQLSQSPTELIGMDWHDSLATMTEQLSNPSHFFHRIDTLLKNKEIVLGEEIALVNGQFLSQDYIPIIENNVSKGHLWIYNNITERKNYERNLIAQEKKYRSIIENMNLGLVEVNLVDEILYVNKSFCHISGYSSQELIGKKAIDFFGNPETNALIYRRTELRKKGIADMYQILVRNKQQEPRWWLISGAPRYNNMGEVIGSIGIHLDITEQKEIEKELVLAQKRAEESSLAKEQFLMNMSHEIRTPLNGIIGMVRELAKTPLNTQQNSYVKHTHFASQHLLAIVNNILDISKIDAGELSIEQRNFSLSEVLQEAQAIVLPLAQEKKLTLSITHAPDIAPVLIGDPMRIRQILINLLGNAIKFTEKGSVGVECVLIEEHFFYQKIRISVWDTGIGMDSMYIKRLFDKFSQEDITIARKYGGSGLGMAISYELLQLMGGTIFTHSEKGIGTRFDIELTLPISSQEAQEEAIIPTEINHLAQKRVLLVEDNELNRLVASNTLAHYKIEIVEATNGLEAIEALKKEGFDVILMDLQMPIMDGLTATRIIRSELQLQIPIIALTANAFKSEIDKCKAAGMNDYITKPFEEKILIKTIERALNPLSIPLITPTQPVALSNTEALYNLQAITAIGNGDRAFLNKYIHLFITQSNNALQQLKNHYANGDWNEIKSVAHSIKSSMLMLQITGAMPEIMLLEAHESHALAATEIGESIERLSAALHAVIEQLSAELTA